MQHSIVTRGPFSAVSSAAGLAAVAASRAAAAAAATVAVAPTPRSNMYFPQDSFPSELLHLIVRYALPPESDREEDFPQRNKLLGRYAVVCKAFAKVCQRILFERVFLARPKAAMYFSAPEAPPRAGGLTFLTKWLGIGSNEQDRREDSFELKHYKPVLPGALMACPAVTELWISHASFVDPALLSWAVHLKSLQLTYVDLEMPTPRPEDPLKSFDLWHFPSLERLGLDTVSLTDDKYIRDFHLLLTPLCLPKLTTLIAIWDEDNYLPDFSHIAGQLESLFLLRRETNYDRSQATARARSAYPSLPLDAFPRLSTRLRHLSIDIHRAQELNAVIQLKTVLEALSLHSIPANNKAIETSLVQHAHHSRVARSEKGSDSDETTDGDDNKSAESSVEYLALLEVTDKVVGEDWRTRCVETWRAGGTVVDERPPSRDATIHEAIEWVQRVAAATAVRAAIHEQTGDEQDDEDTPILQANTETE